MSPGAACCGDIGGIATLSRHATHVCTWATLRHFDSKLTCMVNNGPLIPCERRLRKVEILENQEVTFGPGFGIRDYDRPFGHISLSLSGFD